MGYVPRSDSGVSYGIPTFRYYFVALCLRETLTPLSALNALVCTSNNSDYNFLLCTPPNTVAILTRILLSIYLFTYLLTINWTILFILPETIYSVHQFIYWLQMNFLVFKCLQLFTYFICESSLEYSWQIFLSF